MSADTSLQNHGYFLFCANDLYAQHMAACIVSMLENSSLEHHDVCVVGKFEDEGVAKDLEALFSKYPNATLRIVNFLPPESLRLPTRMHWTADTFSRFWVDDFFDETVGRVLYLDSDMIVTGDIRALWEVDLEGAMFGAVTIPGSDRTAPLQIPESFGYFNNGVLLFDMDEWRKQNPLSKLLPYIEKKIDDLPFLDQDALNACYYDKRCALDYRWNMIVPFTWKNSFIPLPRAEQQQIVDEAHIVHFNGQTKPWHYINDHPYKAAYWKYVRMTPWCEAMESGKSLINNLKKLYNKLIPQHAREYLWRLRGRGE
ncbi:MAG: glycosyltransferase family 8 protein [Kordiimonas sp.]